MKNKQNNKGNLYKKIRNILIITLIAITGFFAFKLVTPNVKSQPVAFKQEAVQKQAINDVAKWQNTINQLKAEFKKDASLNVLQGIASINISFTDKDTTGSGNTLSFLQKKWNEWSSKTLNVSTEYKFGYAFNLSDVQIIDFGEGNIKIKLNQNNLDLKYVEEQTDKTVLDSKVGFFAKNFSVQETQAISNRTKIHVSNTLRSRKDLRDASMKNLQEIITDIGKELGFKNIQIDIQPDFLLENTEVNIVNVTYNN
jgi:uncharacterized membrane protein YjgN (DUF898 family)